jgi:hypothetical protein
LFRRASRGAVLRKKKARGRAILAVAVPALAAVAAFLYIFRPPPARAPEESALFVAELSEHYCQDQTARADLTEIVSQGLPAFARLARLDENGTWSLIFLGPFKGESQAAAAADFLRGRGLYVGRFDIKADPPPPPPAGPVVLELAPFLNDEALFEELAQAAEQHLQDIYALGRTAEVDPENGQAWNHIYLGPFRGIEEADQALGRLQNWDLAHDYLVLPIELGAGS